MTRIHYHLPKQYHAQYMNLKKVVGFKNTIKKHDFLFYYNIRSDPLLNIGYVDVRRIPCSCYVCLIKLDSPCNRSQYK